MSNYKVWLKMMGNFLLTLLTLRGIFAPVFTCERIKAFLAKSKIMVFISLVLNESFIK